MVRHAHPALPCPARALPGRPPRRGSGYHRLGRAAAAHADRYLYRDGLFYFRTATDAVKAENIRRDPRVSICVQDERPPYKGLIVHGTAEVRDGLDWLGEEMPRRYLGFVGSIGYRLTARQAIEQSADVALVVRPERITSFDYSAETPLFGRLWLLMRRVLPPWL